MQQVFNVKEYKLYLWVNESVKHDALIQYLGSEEIGGGYAMIFKWIDGDCMGKMYAESHRIIMELPVEEKMWIFDQITDFLIDVIEKGYFALDF